MIMLKNKLFDSPLVNTDSCLPVNVFNEICDRFESEELKACFASVQESLIVGISDGEMINLGKFSQLVDLYEYLPSTKAESLNKSPQIHQVLSSNTRDQATHIRP
jgi:hypothetical protein